jgi:hypothetical protein
LIIIKSRHLHTLKNRNPFKYLIISVAIEKFGGVLNKSLVIEFQTYNLTTFYGL